MFWFVYSSSLEFITPADSTITDEGLILRFFSVPHLLWQGTLNKWSHTKDWWHIHLLAVELSQSVLTSYNILIAFMVSFDNYYLTYKVILKCFLDFASVFLYHETVELFPSHGVHCLVPWHCYAPHHKGQVDYKSIQGKIGANPLRMCRKFAISCQCSVGVYQDFLTTDHNLNLNYINKKCKSTL